MTKKSQYLKPPFDGQLRERTAKRKLFFPAAIRFFVRLSSKFAGFDEVQKGGGGASCDFGNGCFGHFEG